jgi:hypothetical protein
MKGAFVGKKNFDIKNWIYDLRITSLTNFNAQFFIQ